MTNGGGEQPENENALRTSSRGRSKSGESVVAWTTFFWAALSGGAIALSVAASSLGREATEKGATMWMADAGGSLKDSFLGFYGVLGTIVVAMVADRAFADGKSRPSSLQELKRRYVLGVLSLVISVAATYMTALLCWYFAMHGPRDLPLLFMIVPLNIIVVALSISVASAMRPTLNRQLRAVERDRDKLESVLEVLLGKTSRRPVIVIICNAVFSGLLGVLGSAGLSLEAVAVAFANAFVTGGLWIAICVLLAASGWAFESKVGRSVTVVCSAALAVLFSGLSFGITSEYLGIARATLVAVALFVLPLVSSLLAPARRGPLRKLSGWTIGAAGATWSSVQFRNRLDQLNEHLVDLQEEKQGLLASRGQ